MPSHPIIFVEPHGSERSPYGFINRVKFCCGIDVHKTFVVACIATNKQGVTMTAIAFLPTRKV